VVQVVQIFPVRQLVYAVNLFVREEARVHAYYMAQHGRVAAVRRGLDHLQLGILADGRRARVRVTKKLTT
jgi:hypothetical protein